VNKLADPHAEHEALDRYLTEAHSAEVADASLCLRIARAYSLVRQHDEAYRWLARVVDAGDSFRHWSAAAGLLARLRLEAPPPSKRLARVAVVGTYTTSQLGELLRLAALRLGIDVELHQSGFSQYSQELLDPGSALHEFEADYVVLATHDGALQLPSFSDDPDADVEIEVRRWASLWDAFHQHSDGRLIHHGFAVRPETPFGHLSRSLAGSRHSMSEAVNVALGEMAADRVSIVDCERLASSYGKWRWFDDRYWFAAKQAVALDALPLLARHTAAVLGACLGVSRKCLVLDLDNTLWGGVIGEDGLEGIQLGAGVEGEAYVEFQRSIRELSQRGVILAVVSKNNDADAREPFERHPDMVLRLDDFALFLANWDDKATNLLRVAETLNIGLDALVLVDDSPVERRLVRRIVPDVDVIVLPPHPSGYVRALSQYAYLEPGAYTPEDRVRTAQYRVRASTMALESSAGSVEDFYRSLGMRAVIAPFDELDLPRIVQLIAKTNQFNVTSRRCDAAAVRRLMANDAVVHMSLRLEDNLTDHGLVGVLIAMRDGDVLDIDTWLMSCRVIGRTVEHAMAANLCRRATAMGCSRLRGMYVPTAKNSLVADLYPRLGFEPVSEDRGMSTWEYDIATHGAIQSPFVLEMDASNVG
jgi:FkbH-like protein